MLRSKNGKAVVAQLKYCDGLATIYRYRKDFKATSVDITGVTGHKHGIVVSVSYGCLGYDKHCKYVIDSEGSISRIA